MTFIDPPLPGIRVDPAGQTNVAITITSSPSGLTPTIYADVGGVATKTMPATISKPTTFFVPNPGAYTVNGVTLTVEGNQVATVDLSAAPGAYPSSLGIPVMAGNPFPPTSGNWSFGQVFVDNTGVVWTCVQPGLAGSTAPPTFWPQPGTELTRTEVSVVATFGTLNATSLTTIVGLTASVNVVGGPLEVEFWLPSITGSAAVPVNLALLENVNGGGSTQVAQTANLTNATAGSLHFRPIRRTPPIGQAVTYFAQYDSASAQTLTAAADNYTTIGPCVIRIRAL